MSPSRLSGAAEQLNLIMKAISFTFALIVALAGFCLAGWNIANGGRPDTDTGETVVLIIGTTIVLAAFIAAIGGLMPWDVFTKIYLRPSAAGGRAKHGS